MKLGLWAAAPQTARPDAELRPAFAALTKHGGGVDQNYLYTASVLKRAEDVGFTISLIAQRWLGPDLDSWVFATALATQTKSIKLMAAVHPGIMDPRISAKMAASIDRISGGRFLINVVNGGRPHELEMFGDRKNGDGGRYKRMHEFITVMKGLMSNDRFTYHGDFYDVENGSVPTKSVQYPCPPIFAASNDLEGMKVIAQECDTWFVNYEKDLQRYESNVSKIASDIKKMTELGRSYDRTLGYGINACVIIGDTDQAAYEAAATHVALARSDPLTNVGAAGIGAGLVGSPKTIVDRIKRYEELGVDLLMIQLMDARSGLEEFAEKIIPRLSLT